MSDDTPVDEEFFTHNHVDPYDGYTALRHGCPVYHDPTTKAYFVSRYDEVAEIFKTPTKYSARAHRLGALVSAARAGTPIAQLGEPRRTALVHDDDPYHAFLRALIARSFTPRAIGQLAPMVESIAEQLFKDVPPDGIVDVVPVLCMPLPSRTIAAMYGVPDTEYLRFNKWSEDFLSPDPAVHLPAIAGFNEYFLAEMHDRRVNPRDDMITHLAQARQDDGEPLPDDEILALLLQNILAGNETTTNLLTNMLLLLAQRPELWSRARADRALVNRIVEETLRFESPVQWMPRTAREDVVIDGVSIKKGSTILPMMGSANRDDDRWAAPTTFDPDAERSTRHLAFGLGVHFCVGAPLARLEASTTLNGLLDRYAAMELAGEPKISNIFLGVRGYHSLPLRFSA